MRYKTDITDTEKQTPTDDDIRGAEIYYEYGESLKPELTLDFLYEQLGKKRLRHTGLRKTRFSLIGESLSKNRKKKR